jgi:hypothetical protein
MVRQEYRGECVTTARTVYSMTILYIHGLLFAKATEWELVGDKIMTINKGRLLLVRGSECIHDDKILLQGKERIKTINASMFLFASIGAEAVSLGGHSS